MDFLGYAIFILFLTILPILIGSVVCVLANEKEYSFIGIEQFIWGHLTLIALFQIVCLICVPLRTTFTLMTNIYIVLVAMVIVVSVLWIKRSLKKCDKTILGCIKFFVKDIPSLIKSFIKTTPIRAYIFYIGILCIILCYVLFMNVSGSTGDDDSYLSIALCALKNDSIFYVNPRYGNTVTYDLAFKYTMASWSQYIAFLGRISGVHPTIIAHTLLPVLLVILAFGVYMLISHKLFDTKKEQYSFLIILLIITIMGGYSWYTLTFRLLVCLWQGKGVMAAIIIPFTLYYSLFSNIKLNWHTLSGFFIILLAGFSASYMSVGFVPIIILCSLISNLIHKKNNTNADIITSHTLTRKKSYMVILLIFIFAFTVAFIYLKKSNLHLPTNKSDFFEQYSNAWNNIKLAYSHYWNNSYIKFLFFASLLFTFISCIWRKKSHLFSKYLLVSFVLLFNPVSIFIIHTFLPSWNEFIRSFYILFPEIVMAYALTILISSVIAKKYSLLEFLYILPIIFLCKYGTSFNTISQLQKADNVFKIPHETVNICNYISPIENMGMDTHDTATIITPESRIATYIRQFNSDINIVWSRWDFQHYPTPESRIRAYYNAASKYGAYVILDADSSDRYLFEKSGACVLTEIDGYVIYDKINKVKTETGYEEFYGDSLAYCLNEQASGWTSHIVDDNGRPVRTMFYDFDKNPINHADGYGQIGYEYDEQDRIISSSYFDTMGNPLSLPAGYHIERINYISQDDDRWNSASYYDSDGKPTNIYDGAYQSVNYYYLDESQYAKRCEYLKSDGMPAIDTLGYFAVEYEYDADGRIVTYKYYGADDEPILYNNAYYQIHYTYDENNNIVQERFFDDTYGYVQDYDDKNRIVSKSFFDLSWKPINIDGSYHSVKYYYAEGSQYATRYEYTKADGSPAIDTLGFFAIECEYDNNNYIIKKKWFDENNNPVTLSGGQAVEEYMCDTTGKILTCKYYGIGNEPILCYGLYYQSHYTYDENNNIIKVEFFDKKGQPMLCKSGYYGYEQDFNDKNQVVAIKYYDLEWNKTLVDGWYFEQRPIYDEENTIISYEYYDMEGNQIH